MQTKDNIIYLLGKFKILITVFLLSLLFFIFFKLGSIYTCDKSQGYLKGWSCVGINIIGACVQNNKYYAAPNLSVLSNEKIVSVEDLHNSWDGWKKNVTENYNCMNFTEDLINWCNENNVKCTEEIGYTNLTRQRGHSWVCMHVEPQTLRLVDYSNRFPVTLE